MQEINGVVVASDTAVRHNPTPTLAPAAVAGPHVHANAATCRGNSKDFDTLLKSTDPALKIFVGGLPPQLTEAHLLDYFATFGEVEDCGIKMDAQRQVSRGFGFVVCEILT